MGQLVFDVDASVVEPTASHEHNHWEGARVRWRWWDSKQQAINSLPALEGGVAPAACSYGLGSRMNSGTS